MEISEYKKPKIISILQEKGGAGKTTLATNIARGFFLQGIKVLLIDSDPQGSARDWNSANEGTLLPVIGLDRDTLQVDLKAVINGYEIVIIDNAPRLTKLSGASICVSDLVLIPVQPSPYDIWATANLVELIKQRQEIAEGKPVAAFIISRAIKNTILGSEIRKVLEESGFPVLENYTTQQVIYPTTASEGKSVFESKSQSAILEISNIIKELTEKFI